MEKVGSRISSSYQAVLDMILGGRMQGGTIVEERRLTEEFGISRTPLRQALARLEGEGFLFRQAGRLVVKSVTTRDLIENLHLRRILEAEAILLAVPRISDEDLAVVRTALEQMESPELQTVETHWEVDDLLHRTITAASGNGSLCRIVSDLRRRTRPVSLALVRERFYPSLKEHLAVVEAMEQRDAQKAQEALLLHIDNARINIIRKVEQI